MTLYFRDNGEMSRRFYPTTIFHFLRKTTESLGTKIDLESLTGTRRYTRLTPLKGDGP